MACGSNKVIHAKENLDARFTYQADLEDEWRLLAPDGPVSGDCEDYAITLQKEVGGTLWLTQPLLGGDGHAFLCHEDLCVDNSPYPFELDPKKYRSLKQVHPYEIWNRTHTNP